MQFFLKYQYELSLAHKDIREGPWNLPNVEGASELLISLPPPFGRLLLWRGSILGGIVIIGEQSIIYHNGESFSSLAMKPTVMKAVWTHR